MKIEENILDILKQCRVDKNILYLPNVKLNRSEYTAVNKVLEAIGGKWDRKQKGHIFDRDPQGDIEMIILTGDYSDVKKEFNFFPTPSELAEHLCVLAEIDRSSKVLEPSCGRGSICDAAWKRQPARLLGIDLNVDMKKYLDDKPYKTLLGVDFLDFNEEGWNRIVMNPPFARQQDIDHVMKAYSLLAPRGVLVSVMSISPFYRGTKKAIEFRNFLDSVDAEIEKLPDEAFKESGTMVRTCVVKIVKEEISDDE